MLKPMRSLMLLGNWRKRPFGKESSRVSHELMVAIPKPFVILVSKSDFWIRPTGLQCLLAVKPRRLSPQHWALCVMQRLSMRWQDPIETISCCITTSHPTAWVKPDFPAGQKDVKSVMVVSLDEVLLRFFRATKIGHIQPELFQR